MHLRGGRQPLRVTPRSSARRSGRPGAKPRAARPPGRATASGRLTANRPDPVALLKEQADSRVPDLVPIRHGRMMASPSTFYRGAALIMAADLAGTPVSGFEVQLCGDAHLLNFGVFASPERQMLFDINDFDETLPGPWEWDVKRLAASFEVAGRDLGFSVADRREIVLAGVREYRDAMRRAARMGALDAWYAHLTVEDLTAWIGAEVRAGRLGKKEAKQAAAGCGQGQNTGTPTLVPPPRRRGRREAPHHRRSSARSCRSTTWCFQGRPARRRRSGCVRWSAPIGARWRTGTTRWRSTATSIQPARSSASAAWGRAPGSFCSSVASVRPLCSCRRRRHRRRSWSPSSARAGTRTTAGALSRASA